LSQVIKERKALHSKKEGEAHVEEKKAPVAATAKPVAKPEEKKAAPKGKPVTKDSPKE